MGPSDGVFQYENFTLPLAFSSMNYQLVASVCNGISTTYAYTHKTDLANAVVGVGKNTNDHHAYVAYIASGF